MMAKTHILVGLTCFTSANLLVPIEDPLIMIGACNITILGSILPDIDHPQSFIGQKCYSLALGLSDTFGHRNITHSFWGCLIAWWFSIVICYFCKISYIFSVYFFLGYSSHLLGDYFTNSGVPFFWPVKKRFRFPFSFNTGSYMELGVAFSLCLIIFLLVTQLNFFQCF